MQYKKIFSIIKRILTLLFCIVLLLLLIDYEVEFIRNYPFDAAYALPLQVVIHFITAFFQVTVIVILLWLRIKWKFSENISLAIAAGNTLLFFWIWKIMQIQLLQLYYFIVPVIFMAYLAKIAQEKKNTK